MSLDWKDRDRLNQYLVQLRADREGRAEDEAVRLVGESWVGRFGRKHLVRRILAANPTLDEDSVQAAIGRLEEEGRLVVIPRPKELAPRGARARYRLEVEGHHAMQAPGRSAPVKDPAHARAYRRVQRESVDTGRQPFGGRVVQL